MLFSLTGVLAWVTVNFLTGKKLLSLNFVQIPLLNIQILFTRFYRALLYYVLHNTSLI